MLLGSGTCRPVLDPDQHPAVRAAGVCSGRHPSGVLLVAQLLAVLAYPFADNNALGRALLGLVGTAVVLIALWAVRRTPALGWVAGLLGGPALVFTVLEAFFPDTDAIVLCSALLHAPFYFYVSYGMIRYLFHDDKVTTDELYATGAAFTVVAWGFAYVFVACQVVWPGSFVGAQANETHTFFDLLFLSFTNLTSVGLSDILPALGHARSLVMVEQVAGVLYVALVVARLVGLTVARAAKQDRRRPRRPSPRAAASWAGPRPRAGRTRRRRPAGPRRGWRRRTPGRSTRTGRCTPSRWRPPGSGAATRRPPRATAALHADPAGAEEGEDLARSPGPTLITGWSCSHGLSATRRACQAVRLHLRDVHGGLPTMSG